MVPKKVVLERARDTRHYYYYCLRSFVDTRLLLSSEKTPSTLDCGGFVVVEEFGREAAAAEVPGSISGACIQEPGLRSSVGRERETETEKENLREQEVICNCMLFGLGRQGYRRIRLLCSGHRERHGERAGGEAVDENRKQT